MNLSATKRAALKALHPGRHNQQPLAEHTPSVSSSSKEQIKPETKRAEYRVVEAHNGIAELELKVNDMLAQGWKLIGGITFDRGCAYQSMARITSDPIEPTVPPPTLTI